MAKVTLRVEFDGGRRMEFVEVSLLPIHGGTDAVMLAQGAMESLARASGIRVPTPEQAHAEQLARDAAAEPPGDTVDTPDTPAGQEKA